MAAEEFVVRDGRSGYGVVFLSHMDTDEKWTVISVTVTFKLDV